MMTRNTRAFIFVSLTMAYPLYLWNYDSLRGLDNAKVIEVWRGLRPCTPDGLPIISRSEEFDNLIVAAGHAMLGMSLGPITGKIVSQIVNGEKTDVELSSFRSGRF